MIKEINKDKAICERCGRVMNIPKSYARLCYDCANDDSMNRRKILEKAFRINLIEYRELVKRPLSKMERKSFENGFWRGIKTYQDNI